MRKIRLDIIMVRRALVESCSIAQRLIMAGLIRVNGQIAHKPSEKYQQDVMIDIQEKSKYVSRGGEKLAAGLDAFRIGNLSGLVCADIGASTGGFTDCLLQRGADKVYAVDVGYGQLDWTIRNNKQVVVLERVNARYLDKLPEPINLVTIDVSFISLKKFFMVIKKWFGNGNGQLICLIKPQFEVGKDIAAKGKGVIKNIKDHHGVLRDIIENAIKEGYSMLGLIPSPIKGNKGNIEYLAYFQYPNIHTEEIDPVIIKAIEESAHIL